MKRFPRIHFCLTSGIRWKPNYCFFNFLLTKTALQIQNSLGDSNVNNIASFLNSRFCRRHGSSVGRARDFSSGGYEFDSGSERLLPIAWVGVSIKWPAETEVMVSPSVSVWQHLTLSDISLVNLVANKDVKKPNKTN